jgi:hypothetical protein
MIPTASPPGIEMLETGRSTSMPFAVERMAMSQPFCSERRAIEFDQQRARIRIVGQVDRDTCLAGGDIREDPNRVIARGKNRTALASDALET